jgi:hypothetical protein
MFYWQRIIVTTLQYYNLDLANEQVFYDLSPCHSERVVQGGEVQGRGEYV